MLFKAGVKMVMVMEMRCVGGGGDHDIDAAIACWRRNDKMSDIVRNGQCSDILKNSNLLIKGVVGMVQEWNIQKSKRWGVDIGCS